MRLWHYKLIHHLPRQQLLGQHRECCALRGKGWGKKHATVDYVFKHPYEILYGYHCTVMLEMMDRGYKINPKWFDATYRGLIVGYDFSVNTKLEIFDYPEHNDQYYQECLDNLKAKGVVLNGS